MNVYLMKEKTCSSIRAQQTNKRTLLLLNVHIVFSDTPCITACTDYIIYVCVCIKASGCYPNDTASAILFYIFILLK